MPSQAVERTRHGYADGGPVPVAKRRPWWVAVTRSATATVRELRGIEPPPGMRVVVGADGTPVFVPAVERRPRAAAAAARFAWRRRRTLAPIPVALAYMILNAVQIGTARGVVTAALVAPLFAAALWLTILGGEDRTRATLWILAVTIGVLEVWWLLPDTVTPPGPRSSSAPQPLAHRRTGSESGRHRT